MRDLFIVYVSALFMLAPLLAGIQGQRAREIENRAATPLPPWTLASWLDARAYEEVGDWLRDNLPLRSEAITANAWISFSVLGDAPPSLLVGRNGELFLTENLLRPCAPAHRPEEIVRALAQASAALQRRGIPAWVVVSPSKASVLPERLPAIGSQLNVCAASAKKEMRRRLEGETAFSLVPLWPVFESAAAAGRPLFPTQGRHWNGYAGLLQTRALVEALAPGLWSDDAFRVARSVTSEAELPRLMMNLGTVQREDVYESARPGVSSQTTTQRLTMSENDDVVQLTSSSSTEALIPGSTIVVHDSFMLESRGSFGLFTERVDYVHWLGLASNAERLASLFAGADRVVFQLVDDTPWPAVQGLYSLQRVLDAGDVPAARRAGDEEPAPDAGSWEDDAPEDPSARR